LAAAPSYNEKEWVKGLLESNQTTFRTIYDAYQHQVFSFAFYLTKSSDIAEEVVQEVFIRIWEKRAQLNPDTYLLAYIKKITQNLVMDIFRKANRERSLQQHIYNYMCKLEQQDTDSLLEKELDLVYRQALQQLPPQQSIVFSLSRDENLSYQEIADQLHLSRNTVRNHMAEAIKSVRHYIRHNTDLACLFMAIMLKDGWK
jgi:RNA polymerase sigma-70 factor (ECF subfamily)